MSKTQEAGLFFLGLFLAVGIGVGGYFISQTVVNAKMAANTAEAKGLAERRVSADRANWQVYFRIAGATRASVPGLYKQAEKNQARIVQILKDIGFNDEEIEVGLIDYHYNEYRDENQAVVDQKHTLSGSIALETDKVGLVAEARGAVNKLIAEGLSIENRAPQYHFTKLNDIKPAMLKEAAQNARIAANEFASNAGAKVGRIQSARQGSFFIRDAGAEYGDKAKIEKDVRVVTTITFYLTD